MVEGNVVMVEGNGRRHVYSCSCENWLEKCIMKNLKGRMFKLLKKSYLVSLRVINDVYTWI